MKNLKLRVITEIAVFAALIAVISPFSIPIGPIPISLATLIIYIAAGTLGGKKGAAAVFAYILLGAIGVPVFSNWGAGIPKLLGPTGGFIIGYLPLAYISGLFADRVGGLKSGNAPKSLRELLAVWRYPFGMIIGTIALYTLGTLWFMYQSGLGLGKSLLLCAVPFIPGDAIKIVAATVVSPVLRLSLGRIRAGSK